MTTPLDRKAPPKVLATIQKHGINATFTVETKTFDATLNRVTVSATDTYTQKVSPPARYSTSYSGADLVKQGDASVILPASGLEFTPTENMNVTIGSETWHIVSVSPMRSGDLVAAYRLHLRQ